MVEPYYEQGEMSEPSLHFHEFLFLLGLIAHNCIDSSDSIAGKLQDFYHQKLNFKKASEAQMAQDLTYNEVLERAENDDEEKGDKFADGSSQEEWDEDNEESEEEYTVGNQQLMNELIERKNQQ